MSEVLAVNDWPTNAALIADVAKLYLNAEDVTLDATYGRGRWWTEWRPDVLITNDRYTEADYAYDFRQMDWEDDRFDVVAFDPPYKFNGAPALGDFDNAYGVDQPATWQERMLLLTDGLVECCRVSKRLVLAKCQDQVVSGKIRWQTYDLQRYANAHGFRLVDKFTMVGGTRKQPEGTRQVHARGRGSTLLVLGGSP